jgi:hypothetical protein
MSHLFVRGSALLGLSSCSRCGTLRVEGAPVTFIRRALKEEDRVREDEPPCLPPSPYFRAPW